MSGRQSLIEAYMKNLDKKVTADKAGQNRIGKASAIRANNVRMADIPVFTPTITVRVPERVSDGKPLELPAVKEEPVAKKEPATKLPAVSAAPEKITDYSDPAGMIAEAFALQEENAKAQKPLTQKEQRQADQRKRSREKAQKAEQRQAEKAVVEQAKAQRDAERARLGLEYATAKDPVAALPAYKAGLKAANEAYHAAVNEAAEPERFDPFVQAEGTAEAAAYDAKVVKQGEKSKNNPLNQDPRQWMKGGSMGQASAAIEKKQTLDALDENQRTYINYLYGKYDKATADKLTETLLQNIRNAAILADDSVGAQTQNAFTAIGGNILAAPVYAGEMVGQAVKNLATGANLPVAEYTQGSRMMSEQAARTQAALDDIESPAGQFLAQTGIGMGQNVVNMLLFGSAAPAVMAMQAAGSAGYEAAQNGATGWQQLGKGVQSAVTEYLTEKISWGKLDKLLNGMGAKTAKEAIAKIAAQMATEGGEELVSEAVGMLYDWIAMGDAGDLKQTMNAYRAENGTEGQAEHLALEILRRLGSAALAGGISGGVLGGGAQLLNMAQTPAVGAGRTARNAADLQLAITDDGNPVSPAEMGVNEGLEPDMVSAAEAAAAVNAAQNGDVAAVPAAAAQTTAAQPIVKQQTPQKTAGKTTLLHDSRAMDEGGVNVFAEEESGGYTAANADPQSVSAKKAAYEYKEALSAQKSTESVLDDLSEREMAELDTAFPAQADTHVKGYVKQNEEIARQRVEVDAEGEKKDLKAKGEWNAEDVATAQALLVKLRDDWRAETDTEAREKARSAFNEWYDVVSEHKTVIGQAMRQMQEYVAKFAAEDPNVALDILEREMEKVNAKGKKDFGEKKWEPLKLTDEEISRVENMTPGDTAAFEQIVEDVGKRIQKEYPAKLREKIVEFGKVNMLLNVRTLLKNPLANLLLQGVSRTSRRVSGLAQAAIHAFDHDFVPTQAMHISKDSKKTAQAIWDQIGEKVAGQGQRYERNTDGKEDYSLLKYVRQKEVFKTGKRLPVLGKAAKSASNVLNAISQRATGAELFTAMSEEKSALENVRQLTYGLLELGDRGFMKSAFVDRMAGYIEARGIKDAKDVPDEAYRLALEAAFADTFKDDNAIFHLMTYIKSGLNRVGAGDLLMPFVKTPANVTARTIEYGPAGFLWTAGRAVKAKYEGKIDSKARLSKTVDLLAQNFTGSALVALGALLAHTGRITGEAPEDKDEAAFLEQAGWKPFSFVTDGGKYISFDWAQPAAMTLVLGASAYENLVKENGKGFLQTMLDLGVTYFDTIFEQSTLQEFEKLFGGYGSVGENIIDVLLNYPLRFISSGAYAVTKSTDLVKRETYVKGGANESAQTLLNKMYEKIPGLSKTLPPKYDIWGNVVLRDKTYGEAFINAYLNPGTVTQYKKTPANDEILRLYDSTKNSSVFPMNTERSLEMDVNGQRVKVDCDNKEYSELCKNTGKARSELMDAALKSSWYKALNDDGKVEFLSQMWSLAKVVGKVETFPDGVIPGAVDNLEYEIYSRDGAAGVLRYREAKADADDNGNGSVSQGELLAYLDGKKWTSEEKGALLGDLIRGSNTNVQKVKAQYGEDALSSWYDYYSVLYADAERYRVENGNKNVSLGTKEQMKLAEEVLDGLDISRDQKAYFLALTGSSKT